MELAHLRIIVDGLESLAEIEKEHPALGKKLLTFVQEVQSCCKEAYNRLSNALAQVRSLPSEPSPEQVENICATLTAASDSKWFKEVSGICDRLAALASDFEEPIRKQISYTSPFGDNRTVHSETPNAPRFAAHYRIAPLLSLLQQREHELKSDIRTAVATMETKLGPARSTGNVEDARLYALQVQDEISQSIDDINKISLKISAGSSTDYILEDIAEKALQRPERVLLFNMFFIAALISLGAALFQVISIYQFILLSGFTLTSLIILNAFYLRTIDRLSEESFLKLIELSILKLFTPLSKRKSAARGNRHQNFNDPPS